MLKFDDSLKLNSDIVANASPCCGNGHGGCELQCHSEETKTFSLNILGNCRSFFCPQLTRLPGTLPLGITPDRVAIIPNGRPGAGQIPFDAVSALTGSTLYSSTAEPISDDDGFLPIQDLEDGDFVLFPRVAVFKMRGKTEGASGIFVYRWGLAALSDKNASRFISKIYDSTCCDIYAQDPDSTTLILCPHGCAYILEFQDIGGVDALPHWEYPIPHFVAKYGFQDSFLTKWWAACALAESEVLLYRSIDAPLQRQAIIDLALKEMPEVPEDVRAPNAFASEAIERYPSSASDTKIIVDCGFVYYIEYASDTQQLWISYGVVGQQSPLHRVDYLVCNVYIRRAKCCNFGTGGASALFLFPSAKSFLPIYLSTEGSPNISIVGSALKAPTRMARDHEQGIITDQYRVYQLMAEM